MNAGTIVGYVTRRDGSPLSGAEIWISQTEAFGSAAETKPSAKTDSRGYFQLNFAAANTAEVVGIGGNLNISVGAQKSEKSGRANSKGTVAENRFEVTGYLIRETVEPNA